PILVPNGPRALAVDPRGIQQYLYVVCEVANSVAVVDRRSRQVVRSINVGRRPYAIAMTPGGERAFVTNSDDDTVSVIDTTTNNVVSTIQLVPPTTAQPVGTTGQVTQAIKLTPKGIASNANGTHIYVACAGGYMIQLDGAAPVAATTTTAATAGQNYTATRNLPLTGAVSPLNVAVASETTAATTTGPGTATDSVYISDPQGNKIFYVASNATTANPVQASGTPWGMAVHRNAAGKADRLFVTQSSLNAVAQYTLPDLGSGAGANIEGHNPQSIAASPVGDEIYVSVTGDNNVAVMTVGTNGTLSRPSYFQTNSLNQEFVTSTGEIALGGYLF
ncbi:MAG: cell surface protein, partial [Cyanobacteria bacterium RYN_339]|nr:cell surface protein [Cyanobacteria bacterium RYN_339]